MRGHRLDLLLVVLLAATLAIGLSVGRDAGVPNFEPLVEGQMAHSPAYDSFDRNPNFPDGMTLRTPPAGTISRGHLPLPYKATSEDAVRAGLELHNPFTENDEAARERGGVVFSNFCRTCHGPLAQGDGPVTLGGFPAPPSLLTDRVTRMPDGQVFHVLTYGQGRMPPIASQLSSDDRWRAILHVRQLQKFYSPSGKPAPVTLAEVSQLFQQNCSGCHAVNGTGEAMRKALPNIPDFTSLAWQVSQTEIALVNQIDYGSLPLMPAFRYKLTREQIQGLAVFIRSFAGRGTAGPGAAPVAHLSPTSVYQTYCFACHDVTGRGDPNMRKTMPEIPDFTAAAWQKSRTDADLNQSILQGKGKFMLPMKDKLGPVNATEMVALVRGFQGGKQVIPLAAPQPPGPPPPEGGVASLTDLGKAAGGGTTPPVMLDIPKLGGDLRKPVPTPSGELAARIRTGSVIFGQFCLVCHGPDGTGRLVRPAMPPIPDFTNSQWQLGKSDPELLLSILEGKGTLMPPNSMRVTRDQARDLVAFIRSFGPARPIEESISDTEFDRSVRRLQSQFQELESELKKLNK
jgi:mono/diheme cytochrome c family protein